MNIAPKILIVEDDRTIHRLLARLLEHSGYTVVSAFTLKEAERLFYEHPDLSLISWDGRVPEVEGARIDLDAEPTLQLVRKIRQLFPGPMIAASSSFNSKLMEAGCEYECRMKADLLKVVTMLVPPRYVSLSKI